MPFLTPNQQCQSTEGKKWDQTNDIHLSRLPTKAVINFKSFDCMQSTKAVINFKSLDCMHKRMNDPQNIMPLRQKSRSLATVSENSNSIKLMLINNKVLSPPDCTVNMKQDLH